MKCILTVHSARPEEVVEKEKGRLKRSTDREIRINEILETLN
jgi:hypothetical protein